MATWRRCERCRKVLSSDDFDGSVAVCTPCLTKPATPVRAARAATVTTRRVAPPAADPLPAVSSAPGAVATERAPRQGVVGRGDPEVRARRARTKALQELSDLHADDFDRLLSDARRAEGLLE